MRGTLLVAAALMAMWCPSDLTLPLFPFPVGLCLADTVGFDGTVEPITDPIVLRYRPYPPTPFSVSQKMTLGLDGSPFSVRTTTFGSTGIERSGTDLVSTVTIDEAEIVYGMERQQIDWRVRATIRMSDRGEVREIETQDQESGDAGLVTARQLMSRLSTKLFPRFPESGVKTGDELLSFDMDLSALSGLGTTMRGTSAGIVRGVADFQGRRVIVLDLTLNIETEGTDANGSGSGYGLLDIETGAWLYSEFSAAMDVEMEGQPMTLQMTEVTKTGL